MYFLKLAWRNIFRNKRRTIIAAIAISIGLASLIYYDALMKGMIKEMISSTTNTLTGHAQIHGKNFRDSFDSKILVKNKNQVMEKLSKDPIVKDFTQRVISVGMITSSVEARSVFVYGINPDKEKLLSQVDDVIIDGDYLKNKFDKGILIGKRLADVLELELGSRVVLTVNSKDNELSQQMFKIVGIFDFNNKTIDDGMVFVSINELQKMIGIGNNINEIAILFKNIKSSMDKKLRFWSDYSKDGNEAISWVDIFTQLKSMLGMTDFSLMVVAFILMAIVSFGILNSMFMSIYERMFEFGVLKAIGTDKSSIRKLILFEAGSLAFISIIIGVVLGFIFTYIYTHVGIDYTGIEFGGTTLKNIIYPEITLSQYIIYPLFVFIFTVIISLYPARYINKKNIAEILRKSL